MAAASVHPAMPSAVKTNQGGMFDLGSLPTAAQYNADGTPNSGVYYRPSRTQTGYHHQADLGLGRS